MAQSQTGLLEQIDWKNILQSYLHVLARDCEFVTVLVLNEYTMVHSSVCNLLYFDMVEK